ncbi:T22D4 protein, partial [Podargus strigoides]|nr:T22D4 protein [Podargus strigoides]
MSRKRSGFAITSIRGGATSNGGGGGGGGRGRGAGDSTGSSSPGSSRFRVVRLPGSGEAFRRGRWICRDFYDREALPRGSGRVPLSLDCPRGPPPPPAAPHPHPRSLGAFAELVQQALPPGPPSPRPGGVATGLSARLGLAGEESEEEGVSHGGGHSVPVPPQDLVKGHLLQAVREEVEQLREQIQELRERRAGLERENGILRALATPQQLARLRPQGHAHPQGPP